MNETNGRRAEDQQHLLKLTSISAFVGLAAFVGAIVLWIGDARIAAGIKPISDRQIGIDADLDNMKEIIDGRLTRMEKGIDDIVNNLLKSRNK